jgi:hypothetical protein
LYLRVATELRNEEIAHIRTCTSRLKGGIVTTLSNRALFWTLRALAIVFIAFLSMFALDVFGEGRNYLGTFLALIVHLIPMFILAAGLILAWRWEWIGTVLYGAGGTAYVFFALPRPWPPSMKLVCILMISGPAFAVAALFLANLLKRGELHLHEEFHPSHP